MHKKIKTIGDYYEKKGDILFNYYIINYRFIMLLWKFSRRKCKKNESIQDETNELRLRPTVSKAKWKKQKKEIIQYITMM